tara:strand:+ start:42746 stop:43693 length:948 start_codon:yes stop_codon:yes gene_type:complete
MSKRKLNKQQQRQVDEQQQVVSEDALDGLIVARYGRTADVENNGEVYSCHFRQHVDAVVGDNVAWLLDNADEKSGVIVAVHERRNDLTRPSNQGDVKVIAANVDQMLIAVAVEPENSIKVIDRYLILAELQGIKPTIVYNKIDLLDDDALVDVHKKLILYKYLGYELIYVSAELNHGVDELEAVVKDRTSVLVGLSGVGKSAMSNLLLPGQNIKIGEMKSDAQIGRHTTTTSHLYHMPCGGNLIDSPGIRELSLTGYSARDIAFGFADFRPYLGHCKFSDCSHRHEPGCAILEAKREGKLSPDRYHAYETMVESL